MRKKVILCFAVLATITAVLWFAHRYCFPVSARSLLREAAKTAQKDPGPDVFSAIIREQAKQGFYDDAQETLRNAGHYPEQAASELATIRVQNGDVPGARQMANGWDASMRTAGIEAIAIAQAEKGDLQGARDTSKLLKDKDRVLEAICRYEINSGDMDGALNTIAQTGPSAAISLLIQATESITMFHPEQKDKVRSLARLAKKRHMAKEILEWANWADSDNAGCCGVENSACGSGVIVIDDADPSYAAVKRYEAGDIAGAEQKVDRASSTKEYAMSQLVGVAAKHGDIGNALRYFNMLRALGPYWVDQASFALAQGWAKNDKSRIVIRWARSRPAGHERAMALLGVATAIGRQK
jgi:hypothetical protein